MTARINVGWTVANRPTRRLVATLLVALVALASACSSSGGSVVKPLAAKTPVSTTANPSGQKPLQQTHADSAGPLRVELWGDSLAQQAAEYIRYFFAVGGRTTTRIQAFGGTAICDWLSDLRQELNPADAKAFHPQAVILEFNGNAGTPCMRDVAGNSLKGQDLVRKYVSDSTAAIDICIRAKVPIYFVTNPLDSVTQWALSGFTQVGQVFSQLPHWHPAEGLVRWIDAATALEWKGQFTETLPCEPWETCTGVWPDGTKTVTVRQADGLHFCPVTEYVGYGGLKFCPTAMPGATRYAMAIAGPVLRDFGLSGAGP